VPRVLERALASMALGASAWVFATSAVAADDSPTIVSYGFDGFWTGAQIGFATGYLATGNKYQTNEWRTLVFGAGVGAIAGVSIGLTLGIVDVANQPPPTGWLVLRDVGYGVGLGAIVGTAAGALFLINSGHPKDLLTGASIGSLVAGGAGLAFGLAESRGGRHHARPAPGKADAPQIYFTVAGAEGSLTPLAAVGGTF
jgi:hypothetical protein